MRFQVGSPEFIKLSRELAKQTYEDKIPDEELKKLLALVPNENAVTAGNATCQMAKLNVGTAFFFGTVECIVESKKKCFYGRHWGFGLGGFGAIGANLTI